MKESHRLVNPPAGETRITNLNVAGNEGQEMLDPSQPVVLLRLRVPPLVYENGGWHEDANSQKPCDGVMVWLEREP